MSPYDQDETIALACGWKRGGRANVGYGGDKWLDVEYGWTRPDGKHVADRPHYISDLNEMHQAELSLSDTKPDPNDPGSKSDRQRFREALCVICMSAGGPIHATAAQRAEAFLRVKGLWKESVGQ